MPEVKILPPGLAPDNQHFDLHQFQKRARVSTPETRLSYGEDVLNKMQLQNHRTRRVKHWIPKFAYNAKQLRHVLAQ